MWSYYSSRYIVQCNSRVKATQKGSGRSSFFFFLLWSRGFSTREKLRKRNKVRSLLSRSKSKYVVCLLHSWMWKKKTIAKLVPTGRYPSRRPRCVITAGRSTHDTIHGRRPLFNIRSKLVVIGALFTTDLHHLLPTRTFFIIHRLLFFIFNNQVLVLRETLRSRCQSSRQGYLPQCK